MSRFIRYGTYLLTALMVCFGLYQTWLQYQENQYLQQIAQTLKTGDTAKDIEAAVDYAYSHINLGEGRQGSLRSSALEILDPTVGGQCGEFTRVTILLLDQMGYSARRVYLFPLAPTGEAFDPKSQPSFHVIGEVWAADRWAAIDPLHGIVFYKQPGDLATVSDLATDSSVLESAMQVRPAAIHTTNYGTTNTEVLKLKVSLYQNAQRFNWAYLTYLPGLFPLVQNILGDQLNTINVPLIAERPHELLALFMFGLAGLVFSLGRFAARKFQAVARPASVFAPASKQNLLRVKHIL